MFDFAMLAPEINSARMYAGAGSGPLVAVASAWDALAAELRVAASSHQSLISGLVDASWQGPSSAAMAAVAAAYAGWVSAVAARAEGAAGQARAAVGVFEAARAATVAPVAVAANRAQLMALAAANIFGQNSAAIAAAEAEYEQMWAQNVTAMYGYHGGASAVAAALTPFAALSRTANPAAALSLVGGAAAGTGGGSGTGVEATYTVTSHWGNGFIADYTITNSGTTPLTDWQAQFNLPANESITNVWNGQLAQSGTHYTLTPASWTQTIAPGHSVTVGVQATQTGTYSPPTDLLVNGQPVGGQTPPVTTPPVTTPPVTTPPVTTPPVTTPPVTTPPVTTPPVSTGGTDVAATYAVTSHWDGGFVGDYTITNSGTTPLTDWQAQFNLPANESITNAWNAELAQSGTHYTLTPASWTQTIAPGHSVTVGFQATQTGAYSPPTNLQVNGQPVGGQTPPVTTPPVTTPPVTTPPVTTPPVTTPPVTTPPTNGTTSQEFSPYVDITLWPSNSGYDFAAAANAGVKDVTLAFITADPNGLPAWGGYSAYDVSGGSDTWYINNEIADMHSAGIDGTVSFGGASGTPLAVYAAEHNMSAAQLEHEYADVVNTYGIHKLDFDVEGAAQGDNRALTLQSQALAMLQHQEATAGTPVTVSYTLPVLPTGLLSWGGLNVLHVATANGVDVSRVNVMAMDYGNGFDQTGNPGMGEYAIDAATATHSQLMTLYPSLTSQQAWQMLGVTPLIGINDDPSEVFTLADAQQLTTFAEQHDIGELSMWGLAKDTTGTLGVPDASNGSGVQQTPFGFSKIFEQVEG